VYQSEANLLRKIEIQDRFERENRIAARIILSDIERYGGNGSLMVEWAYAVVKGQK
jgi:hypothetical protein